MSTFRTSRPRAVFSAVSSVVLFVFLAAGVGSVQAKDDAPTRLLNAEMPRGTTLETASCPETVYATRQAVKKNPSLAVPIMQRAIDSRVSPGDRHASRERDGKDTVVPCECLTRIVQAAVESAPASKVHELIEVAMSTQPQCAKEITELTGKQRIDGKDTPKLASNTRGGRTPGSDFGDRLIGDGQGGFGDPAVGGYGGFPGSPGFFGSPPSGGNAFPPIVLNPVTSAVNP